MPKSFLVKMRSTAKVLTSEIPRDTSTHIHPKTSSNLQRKTLDHHEQLIHSDVHSLKQRETSGGSSDTHLVTPQPRRYLPTMTPYPLPTSGLPMTSHHNLLPRYIAWSPVGWYPTDGSEFMHLPHAPPGHPQIIRERPQTWECSVPNFLEIHQRRWSAREVAPQAQFPGNSQRNQLQWNAVGQPTSLFQRRKEPVNEKQPFRHRDDRLPIIKDFYSVEEVPRSKPRNKKEEKVQRDEFDSSEKSLSNYPDSVQELAPKYLRKLEHRDNQLGKGNGVVSKAETAPGVEVPTGGQRPNQGEKDDAVEKRRQHEATQVSEKSHVCTHCNKTFNRASNLHTHIKTHSDHKPHTCDYCGKGFHQKIDKRIHSYTHTGEKPYKCQICGRGFKQLTHLNYHMRTHSDEHMYQCTYCGKGFNQKGNLQAHIYRHTGERPFKCDVCGKGFTLRSTLNTHLRTHATQKPFVCQYCDKAFYQKNALKMHHIASHPIVDGKSIL